MPRPVRESDPAKRFVVLALLLGACAAPPPPLVPPERPRPAASMLPSPEIQRRVDADRVRALEVEVDRLHADLRAAEKALLAVESGMRGAQGRAEAVSGLAEARIQVERAARRAPWRADVADEARQKLAEADRQLGAGHIGSAVFFVSRASRIAESLVAESDRVSSDPNTRFVSGDHVNVRARPSQEAEVLGTLAAELPVFVEGREGDWSLVRTVTGHVGFVHSSLLRPR